MKIKQLTFLLLLTFMFLFAGSLYGEEPEVKREYWDNGKLKSEVHYNGLGAFWYRSGNKLSETPLKNGKGEGLETIWYESGKKKSEKHYEIGTRKIWNKDGKLTYERNYIDGVEEIQ